MNSSTIFYIVIAILFIILAIYLYYQYVKPATNPNFTANSEYNQINSGAKPFIDVEPNVIDGYLIALAELEQRKLPFIIKRPLSNGGCEYWKLKDLEQII